nr:hypothetical protein A4A49_55016 [Ipomoea batatas]GMD33111.1 hypothetical protein A4A49_55016 [Ipomoea batatas]
MRIQKAMKIGLKMYGRKFLVLSVVSLLAISSQATVVAGTEKKPPALVQMQPAETDPQRNHSSDVFSPSMRRVPNALNPLHNR